MTGRPAAVAPRTRLLERLLGAVRPEFRSSLLVFDADDPVFGGGACRIEQCRRPARGQGMCPGHLQRWVNQGRPDLAVFVAATDPGWQRQRPNARCRVDGCGYGSARSGMCELHGQQWQRAGRPDLEEWRPDRPIKQPAAGVTCRIEHCRLWPQAASPFCHAHRQTWNANGRPDIDEFAAGFSRDVVTEDEAIRLDRLGPQLALEIQYALQCRRDEHTTKTFPTVVMQVVRFLTTTTVTSLLDRSESDWKRQIGRPAPKDANPRALLIYARRKVEDLADADGWDSEYPRDTWLLRRLGFPGHQVLNFADISQQWLRDLVKRWVRWRLGIGLGLDAARRGLRALTRFARFCDRLGVSALAQVNRLVLERYLADLQTELSDGQRGVHIGQLNNFLHAVRQHNWENTLPATAVLFPDDHPKRSDRPPRALTEQVMAQVERPDNLDRWDNPAHRLVTQILIGTGLRVSDALRLKHDCIALDAQSAPYLRYFNHKMKREALVPIDEHLHRAITDQQAAVSGVFGAAAPILLPRPTKNPDGTAPISSNTYRAALHRWLRDCDVRDEHGRAVHLTPHQWRHTLGTRLINRDVPQEVVRRILDHDSPMMTAHYARLHDTTVRRHWEAARKVDITGHTVVIDPDGPLAEATWAKQRLGRATQALPNGFCGLPVQKSCPHANACLTCPMFLTTGEFLPQHHDQRRQTLQLITAAEANGHTRLVEMNRQVLGNLDRIITSLTDDEQVPDAG